MHAAAISILDVPKLHREARVLGVPTGATLPPSCVKCGNPSAVQFVKRNFRWHAPWVYLLILAGVIPFVMVALVAQKSARVAVPFCEQNHVWRKRMYVTGTILLLGWVPIDFGLAVLDVNGLWIALGSAVMILAGLVVIAIVENSFSPVYVDESYAKFKGAGEQFLKSVPAY